MLALTISWIATCIIFLSFGDMLISLYNKLCKRNEEYGFTDTFFAGMCTSLIPLSITSFWLPANHYVLASFIILSIIYWFCNKNRFNNHTANIKNVLKQTSLFQTIVFVIPVLGLMVAVLWQVGVFDSLLYHQQNIRWNEEFAIVPGLGNIEHRFGFNSNYLLLSAIFSLRFMFGESVYGLQVLVLAVIICWTIRQIIQSGYEVRTMLLLVAIIGYIFSFGYSLTATSTDAIPSLLSLYIIAKILLNPDNIKNKSLFFVVVPITLLTFKLTIIPLCLISLYILIVTLKKREFRQLLFLISIPSLIMVLWMVRNVIISGYLVFPFHEIDFFSVDWKIPNYVAVEERDFIFSCGIRILHDVFYLISHPELNSYAGINRWVMNLSFIAPTLLSPFIVLYAVIKKKHLSKMIYFVYGILLLTLMIWYIGGPDPRFIGGILFAVFYFIFYILLSTKDGKQLPIMGQVFIGSFALLMGYWAISRSIKFYNMFNLKTKNENSRPVTDLFIKQYPYRELLKSATIYTDEFLPYKMENGSIIYISKSPEIPHGRFVCFESPFPCTVLKADEPGKYQDISTITTRGKTFQDGFKVK